MGLGKVCLRPNHRTIPGGIRRAAESRSSLTQDGDSSGSRTWLRSMVSGTLGCFRPFPCAVGVLFANISEGCRAFLRKVSRHTSPAIPVSPEEKPRQDYCVTKGETGSDIRNGLGIFGKHITIFNSHQIWSGAKSLQCVNSCSSTPDSWLCSTDTFQEFL